MLFFRYIIASLEVHAVMKVANTETDKKHNWPAMMNELYFFRPPPPPLARYFNIRMKLK